MAEARSPAMGFWNVRVRRDGTSVHIGRVWERSEQLARCAALSQFGRTEEEPAWAGSIGPDEDFDVSPE